jgi:hypothetical protein
MCDSMRLDVHLAPNTGNKRKIKLWGQGQILLGAWELVEPVFVSQLVTGTNVNKSL